jgi:UDPglucose 6-dehydrogenase
MLKKALKKKLFYCTIDYKYAITNSDISFIAVGTPSLPDGSIDLGQIKSVSKNIGEALKEKNSYHLIVVKSTVVPSTSEKIVKPIIEEESNKKCGKDFGLCMSPEFLREGSAIYDTLNPDRIVIGGYDKKSINTLEKIYKKFYDKRIPPIIKTNLSTAELIKYASNAFLAMKISFINTIANICEKIPGADIVEVAKGIGLDKRIGPYFLNAGLGYGGSCFPKDVKALIAFSKELGYNPLLIESVEEVNKLQSYKAIELAKKLIGNLENKRIAILGLAFKPNTDDMREAVSIKIINKLLEEKAEIIAYDPMAIENARKIFGEKIKYASSVIDCIKNADCCIIVTEWEEFKKIKPETFIKYMRNAAIVDGRRIYDPKKYSKKIKIEFIGYGK